DQRPALTPRTAHQPEAPETARHLEEKAAAGRARARPVEGGAHVVVLAGEAREPGRLVGPGELALAAAHELGEELEVAPAVLDDLARVDQLLLGVLADAAEKAVPGGPVLLLDDHQVARDEVVEEIQDVEGVQAVARGHGFGALERPAAA